MLDTPDPTPKAPASESLPVRDDGARPSSRISGFYMMDMDARVGELVRRGVIDEADARLLREHKGGLELEAANQMVENAIGVLELPLGLGLNFRVNARDYLVPMAVEEPSIIAAVSHVARLVLDAGGFEASCDASIMIGQIQVVGLKDLEAARQAILENRQRLVELGNALQPRMAERGGGVRDIEVRVIDGGPYRTMLIVHVLIDTCDAMGANLINSIVEGLAPSVEILTGGQVFLRILSNLADRRVARASCRVPIERLAWKNYTGQQVAEGIALASEFAEADPYRATTHNKGVMNGISAVCVATGNDWRAIEAGAHAYCCRDGAYRPMATWRVEDGHLVGRIETPLAVGIVGGPIRLHPTVQLALKILRVDSAQELAQVMAAVGLAQNMGALKALATEGIQRGHMSLHARSVAATAGARAHELDQVVERLIALGDIKVHEARRILEELRQQS